MIVVATGVIVTKQPEGFTVVGWHRHDRPAQDAVTDAVYMQLTEDEMLQVLASHLGTYVPGDECEAHTPYPQQRFF